MEESTRHLRPVRLVLVLWLGGIFLASAAAGGLAAAWCVGDKAPLWLAALVGGAPLALLGTYACLYYRSVRFALDERYISKVHGVLWKVRRSIPLEKITNLDVRRGPLERAFGIGRIWIFTPSTGAALPEEVLFGLREPEKLKAEILARKEAAAGAEAGAFPRFPAAPRGDETLGVLREIRDSLRNIEKSLAEQQSEREGT
jgi:membrane protein YdbS with pleckstrin-like domain